MVPFWHLFLYLFPSFSIPQLSSSSPPLCPEDPRIQPLIPCHLPALRQGKLLNSSSLLISPLYSHLPLLNSLLPLPFLLPPLLLLLPFLSLFFPFCLPSIIS